MLAALAPGSVWVQMSTIGVAGIERVKSLVETERPDVTLVDAPVSGSKGPAENGELSIFASGPAEARSRLDPLFDALGQRTIWVGPVGTGSRLKLVANVWLALAAEAVNTSLALAHGLGVEAESVVDGSRAARWCPHGKRPSCLESPRATTRSSSPCRLHSKTYTSPSRRPATSSSVSSSAWLTSGNRSWGSGWATRT